MSAAYNLVYFHHQSVDKYLAPMAQGRNSSEE